MHADTLYHRMLDQEKAQKEAEKAGLPIPQFPPILQKPRSAASAPASVPAPLEPEPAAQTSLPVQKVAQMNHLTPEARAELKKRMKDKPEVVRELEQKAMLAEAESDVSVAKRVSALQSSGMERRKERREKGEATLGDTISGWFGW